MKSLAEIYKNYNSDKGTDHSYIEIYEKLFAPFRLDHFNLFEIGISAGESLRMWKEYFPNATIYGMDITDKGEMQRDGFVIHKGDSRDSVDDILAGKSFRVIIDDGDHAFYTQRDTFQRFFKFVENDGLYVIEDIENINKNRYDFLSFAGKCEIIDLRTVKGRSDDVLAIYRKG